MGEDDTQDSERDLWTQPVDWSRVFALLPVLRDPDFSPGRWHQPIARSDGMTTMGWAELSSDAHRFVSVCVETGAAPAFDWPEWINGPGSEMATDPTARASAGLEDLRRLLTALIRQDRFDDGILLTEFQSGRILQIVERLEELLGYSDLANRTPMATGTPSTADRVDGFVDTSKYSDDQRYRWWYERRWGPGESLCWVGLNPSTGDTTGRARPTLRKIVQRARGWGLDAVIVVNLFSFRATDPRELKALVGKEDIVGTQTDEVIAEMSARATKTLAAWGAGGSLLARGKEVAAVLSEPVCLGTTKHGEPRHPLYVPADTKAIPYLP